MCVWIERRTSSVKRFLTGARFLGTVPSWYVTDCSREKKKKKHGPHTLPVLCIYYLQTYEYFTEYLARFGAILFFQQKYLFELCLPSAYSSVLWISSWRSSSYVLSMENLQRGFTANPRSDWIRNKKKLCSHPLDFWNGHFVYFIIEDQQGKETLKV